MVRGYASVVLAARSMQLVELADRRCSCRAELMNDNGCGEHGEFQRLSQAGAGAQCRREVRRHRVARSHDVDLAPHRKRGGNFDFAFGRCS